MYFTGPIQVPKKALDTGVPTLQLVYHTNTNSPFVTTTLYLLVGKIRAINSIDTPTKRSSGT